MRRKKSATVENHVESSKATRGPVSMYIASLLPQHMILLGVFDIHHEADAWRFIRIFRETWAAIPWSARLTMLTHWSLRRWLSPVIDLSDMGLYFPKRGFSILGTISLGGHGMSFWSPAIDVLSDLKVRAVIAHELAHVYCHATEDESHARIRPEDREWYFNTTIQPDHEKRADELVTEVWGVANLCHFHPEQDEHTKIRELQIKWCDLAGVEHRNPLGFECGAIPNASPKQE